MAEISYPFDADSAGGGSKLVSQVQWQAMAHMMGHDRIDFQLTNASYESSALPFYTTISGQDIVVRPGKAFIGGFYYVLDSTWTQIAPTNSTSLPRVDLLVLRADITAGSVNLAIKTGQAAANPTEPTVTRTPGSIWEMPVCAIRCEANNGTRTISDRRRFDAPGMVYTPWNVKEIVQGMPLGSFGLDMDINQNAGDTPYEAFFGRDGFMPTRHLGKRRVYAPDVFTVSNKPPESDRVASWRYIAPGMVHLSVRISNRSTKAVTVSSGTIMGFGLPVSASAVTTAQFEGFLNNPEKRDGMPNYVDIKAKTNAGNTFCYLYYPNPNSVAEGLDGLRKIPGKSTLEITGVYETNLFD